MNVKNSSFKCINEQRRQNSHEAGQNDKVGIEILAGLDEILIVNAFSKEHFFQRDFIAAEIRIHSMGQLTEKRALEMLVELLLRSGQIALSEVDDDDGQVALETSANTTRLARTCCAPAEDA